MSHFGGESFGQKLPPLYKVIQSILQDYPSGQIFKEIIQNADDARATEVKFYLDYRDIQTLPKSLVDSKSHYELDKYRGQALVAYNNAPFTESDWDGIQSLQDSNKAADPHRVGKFGLGFNSVYHITDLPVILSEQYCAFLEPHQVVWDGKPGQRYTLNTLQEIEPCFIDLFSPFGHYFAEKFHNQTIFRFPLRKCESKISKEIFSIERLEQLVDVLRSEARYLLLFLRSVKSIEVIRIHNKGIVFKQQLFKVSMSTSDRLELQKHFFDKMAATLPKQVISYSTIVTVQIEPGNSQHQWALVHRVGSDDNEVLQLANTQCVLSWVSTACELTNLKERGGHLFCSLPLPTEEKAPFKINVNGTFAVCSNRRSLKWEEVERQDDEEGTWNKCLVEKCLPYCYIQMMHLLMTKIPHEAVYSYYPSVNLIEDTPWEGLLKQFYTQLFATGSVLYTPVNGGRWIGVDKAVMLLQDLKRPQAIETALLQMKIPFVKVPDVILEAEQYFSMKFSHVTPRYMREQLKVLLSHIRLTRDDKLSILEYCLSDECYSDLIGLNLLPLANGTFTSFSGHSRGVFLSTDRIPHTLLPNVSDRFIDTSRFSSKLAKAVVKLAKSKKTQLFEINVSIIAELLVPSQVQFWSIDQLERLWLWLQGHQLHYFVDTHIIPVEGKKQHKVLDKNKIIYVPKTSHCSLLLSSALSKFELVIVKCLDFPFLRHDELSYFLRHLNPSDVLSAIAEYSRCVENVSVTNDEARELQSFLSRDCEAVCNDICTVSNICMFRTIQNSLCSINVAKPRPREVAIVEANSFNMGKLAPSYPLIISDNQNNQTLLSHLINRSRQATYKSKTDFLIEFIFPAINSGTYPESHIDDVMKMALQLTSSSTLSKRDGYIMALQKVRFLSVNSNQRCCITELYDPTDTQLANLYNGEPVFPLPPFSSHTNLSLLKECGLKTSHSITGEDISAVITSLVKQQYSPEMTHKKACALINFINQSSAIIFETQFIKDRRKLTLSTFIKSLQRVAWIPVWDTPPSLLSRRTNRRLQWKGSCYGYHLAPPTEVLVLDESLSESIMPWIMGSSICFIKSESPNSQLLKHLLSLPKSTLVFKVLEHFQHVIQMQNFLSNDILSYISHLTYNYLSDAHKELDGFEDYIKLVEWIWIERESCFVMPKATAFNSHPNFQHDLTPFVHILPLQYSTFDDLFSLYGSTFYITDDQIVSVLAQLQGSSVSSDKKVALAISILEWMIEEDIDVSDVLVPIQSDTFEMIPVSEVVYPISDVLRCLSQSPNDTSYNLVHSQVTKDMAKKLNIQTLESHLGIAQDIVTEDVGQHEPLVERIQGILQQYQDTDGYTIVKEMLQNADDAGATELNILFDSRQHKQSGLYYKEMSKIHGPALIIHNNKQFTKEDFVNITRLAASRKGNQRTLKIGKFGVGFCSVYHITDIPSFVTTDQLYIFDPTLTYLEDHIKDRSQPGQKAQFTSPVLQTQTSPFHNLFGFKPSQPFDGTIFRLPFRTKPSKLSKNCHDPVMYFKLLFDRLKNDGSKLLLFLNHIQRITISEIGGYSATPQITLIVQKHHKILHFPLPLDTQFISIFNNNSQETWLICSDHEIKSDKDQLIASVACKISTTQDSLMEVEKCEGEMFCFLPLGLIKTGLSVHVSANFAVTTNRRGIWVSDSIIPLEKEVIWNRQLLNGPVSKAYFSLLKTLQLFSCNLIIAKYNFHSLWPLHNQLMNQNPWSKLVDNLYRLIATEGHFGLFKTIGSDTWLTLRQSQVLQDPILSSNSTTVSNSLTPPCVYDILQVIKDKPIVVLPSEYTNEILRQKNALKFFTQIDFIDLFFSNVHNLINHIELRNQVLLCMFETYSVYCDSYKTEKKATKEIDYFQRILRHNPCLPCGVEGHLLRLCHEAIDPLSSLAILFTDNDNRFPNESFMKSPPCRRAVINLGLIQQNLPHDLLIGTVKRIRLVYTKESKKALRQVKVIVDCLNIMKTLPENSILPELNFLPILKKPENYLLPWKGDEYDSLVSPKHVMHGLKILNLVGSKQGILDCSLLPNFTEDTAKILGISCKPETDVVLHQLIQLINTCQDLTKSHSMTTECKKLVNVMYGDITAFLEQVPEIEQHHWMTPFEVQASNKESQVTLPPKITSLACMWTGCEFVTPSCVAKHWKTNGPLLYPLPPILNDKLHLINAFGCQDKFGISKLLSSLVLLWEMHQDKPVPAHCRNVLTEIVNELNEADKEDFKNQEKIKFYLPDTSFRMQPISNLVYRDVDWCDDNKNSFIFAHSMITYCLAQKMGVLTTREKSLSLHEDDFEKFGQNEHLTVRINNIIRDYPLDVTFVKELVQNADDAGASKVVFIFDKRTHGTKKLFCDNWKELQGPSLLVWNDSMFSESDLKGIQSLGFGGKRQESSSAETIGRFGIGFNVVYNITDCPSFVTHTTNGPTLCILDPQCKYVPNATYARPGGRYNNVDRKGSIWETFSDVASTFSFHKVKGCSKELNESVAKCGTLFRLPFRSKSSFRKSKILHPELLESDPKLPESDPELLENDPKLLENDPKLLENDPKLLESDPKLLENDPELLESDDNESDDGINSCIDHKTFITDDILIDKMKEWIDDIKMMLLFLTNVKCLEVYVIENMPDSSCKMKGLFSCKNILQDEGKRKQYKEVCNKFKEPAIVYYTLESKLEEFFSGAKRISNEKWFIQQGIGNMNKPDANWKFVPSLKPRHGIAARLDPPIMKHFEGNLFCFLPLPISTHLPVHLNGQFILSSARRDLWKATTPGSTDDNSVWNNAIIDALSSSYAILLQTLTKSFPGGLFTCQEYSDIKLLTSDVSKCFWLFPTQRKVPTGEEQTITVPTQGEVATREEQTITVPTQGEVPTGKEQAITVPTQRKVPTGEKQTITVPTQGEVATREEQTITVPSGDWEAFAQSVFKKLFDCNATILPSVDYKPGIFAKPTLIIKWSQLSNKENDVLSSDQSYFFFRNAIGKMSINSDVEKPSRNVSGKNSDVENALKEIGMNINLAPRPVWQAFEAVKHSLPKVDKKSVYQYCRLYCSDKLPCLLEKTKFKKLNTFITILNYILSDNILSRKFPVMTIIPYVTSTWPYNSPFLLTADNQLCVFDRNNPVIHSQFFSLFFHLWNRFLHPELIKLNMNLSYFYNHSDHGENFIISVISEALPKCLQTDCVKRLYLHDQMIYSFLECFHSGVFEPLSKTILSKWALIPSQKYLFANLSDQEQCLLPFVYLRKERLAQSRSDDKDSTILAENTNNFSSTINAEEITKALQAIGMPSLDTTVFQYPSKDKNAVTMVTDISLIEKLKCPDVEEPEKILTNLLLCYQKGFVKSLHELPEIIYHYLGQVNFKTDSNKSTIRSLPLFETLDGTFTELAETVYIWPTEIPQAGQSELLSGCHDVTFLRKEGCWKHLGGREALGITQARPEWLYPKYIFPYFERMSDSDIKQHLMFIKENILDVCIANKTDATCIEFVNSLSNLPIIRNREGELCPARYFADHNQSICNAFNGKFALLPQESDYRDDEWMEFLSKIGLQVKVNEDLFIKLCQAVESGHNTLFENIEMASNSLLTYLLQSVCDYSKECPWSKPHEVLCEVADIKFVTFECLSDLEDISPQYIVNDTCQLTALRGSATLDCARLLWTVKPIIKIHVPLNDNKIKSALINIADVIADKNQIDNRDLIDNLKNISRNSKYCDSSLFDHYSHSPPSKLLKVIIEHLKHLSSSASSSPLSVASLCTMKCIPVTVDVHHPDKLVLVEPTAVVNHKEVDNLKPFLHCLHNKILSTVPVPFLEEIGIKSTLNVEHCCTVLNKMHSYCRGQSIDVNTNEKLSIILSYLLQILQSYPSQTINTQLYLPDINNRLMSSKDLLYVDDERLRNVSSFVVSKNMSILCRASPVDLERQLCHLLPMSCRPLPLSLSCNWSLGPLCNVVEETEFTNILQQTVRHYLLTPTLNSILIKYFPNNESPSLKEAISQYFNSVIVGAEVVAVSNLKIDLCFNKARVCSSPVKYFLDQRPGISTIYIDASIGKFDSKFAVILPMSSTIIRSALWRAELDWEMMATHELIMTLSTLMEAHQDEHFQAICQHFQIVLDDSLVNRSQVFQPRLGEQVPQDLLSRLDDNREDIVFRYLEWVAYKQREGFYVFARIQYPVYNFNGEVSETREYNIMIDDYGNVKDVNIDSLYKFLPYVPQNEEEELSAPHNIPTTVYHPDQKEGNRWLRQSEVDFKACQVIYMSMLNSNPDLAGHVCFLSHQVVEKVLKGVMIVEIGDTDQTKHHLIPLASILRFVNPNDIPPHCLVKVRKLEHYYIPTRYPKSRSGSKIPAECYDVDEASTAFSNAQYIYTTLKCHFYRP